VRRKHVLGGTTKAIRKALAAGKIDEATKLLPSAYQAIDKAAKQGVIKANAAARKKSRLAAAIKRAAA
jgi:small subunit ribosomal protein S20